MLEYASTNCWRTGVLMVVSLTQRARPLPTLSLRVDQEMFWQPPPYVMFTPSA